MPDADATADPLTAKVVDVVDAGLQLGAVLARSLATATGGTDTAPTGKQAIDEIVTFGSATVSNVLSFVTSGAKAGFDLGKRVTGTGTSAAGAQAAGGTAVVGPVMASGSTLRVPLLVENTGQTPTRLLTFVARSLTRDGCEDGDSCTCIPVDVVRFDPETLVVGSRDFEKLTVRIPAPEEAPPGAYRATVTAGEGWFSTVIGFTVIERA